MNDLEYLKGEYAERERQIKKQFERSEEAIKSTAYFVAAIAFFAGLIIFPNLDGVATDSIRLFGFIALTVILVVFVRGIIRNEQKGVRASIEQIVELSKKNDETQKEITKITHLTSVDKKHRG